MAESGLKVGELARRTGVTVRALHHYERIGLLVPSMRTGSGHRLYATRDADRLLRIVLLKRLGFPLAEIRDCLARRGYSLASLIEKQLAGLQHRIAAEMELSRRLEEVLKQMEKAGKVSADDLFLTLEMMNMIENFYSPEQLETLKKRGEALGEEKIQEAQKEWPELIRKMTAEMNAGTDPADAKVQGLAKRWKELVDTFTGGDPGIAASLGKLWKERGPELAGKMGTSFDPNLLAYVKKAWAAAKA